MCLKKEVLEKSSQVEEQNPKIGELSGQNKRCPTPLFTLQFPAFQSNQIKGLQAEQEKVQRRFAKLCYVGLLAHYIIMLFMLKLIWFMFNWLLFHFGLLAGVCWWTFVVSKGLELFLFFLFRFIYLKNWVPPPHKHISCSRRWWISSRGWQKSRLISVQPWRTSTSTVLRSAFWRNKWKVIPKFHSSFYSYSKILLTIKVAKLLN